MGDSEDFGYEDKGFRFNKWLMVALAVILILGSFLLGGNVACNRADGYMAGFACVEVVNYGTCDFAGEQLVVSRDAALANGVVCSIGG